MGGYVVVHGLSDELPSMPPNRHPSRALFVIWEIIPTAASAVITTCYAMRHECAVNHGELVDASFDGLQCRSSFISAFDPGPGMMLGACLIFGCSISSYSYRRQELDRFQAVFFVVAICAACALGAISGSNPNFIMLGYIPWGLCAAIITSAVSHWAMRQCGIRTGIAHHNFKDNKEAV